MGVWWGVVLPCSTERVMTMHQSVDEAIVLAGGRGTRLRSVVSDVPKPLAPVAGRPFLGWVLDDLASSGIRHTVLATGYLSKQIEQYVGAAWKGMSISYSVEDQPRGTGGAIRLAVDQLHGRAAHVINGDTYLSFVPAALQAAAASIGAPMAVALASVADISRYGAVRTTGGKVESFSEKGGIGPGLINAGSYFLDEAALKRLPQKDVFSLEQDFIAPLVASGAVAAFSGTSGFIDIGVPDDYSRAQTQFAASTCSRFFVDPMAAGLLAERTEPRRALFLDRDGVINIDHGYVHSPQRADFVPGIFDICRLAREAGLLLIVVTNQAGVARGLYNEAQFLEFTAWIHKQFAARGLPLLATHYCPHHPQAPLKDWRMDCPSRKPGAGMLLKAARNYTIDMARSLILGDNASDLEAGRLAGIGGGFLVAKSGLEEAAGWLSEKLDEETQ
jgi:D,D-heptose 1,7-bisphosphate phosphatase